MAAKRPASKKAITLRDVVVHVQGMGQRLSKDMQDMEQRLTKDMQGMEHRLTRKIDANTEMLTARMDALEEDITATILDTVKIRKHVGMAVPDEE